MNVDELKGKRDRNHEMHKTTRSIFAMLIRVVRPFKNVKKSTWFRPQQNSVSKKQNKTNCINYKKVVVVSLLQKMEASS